jgi:hypothetical protein
MSLTLPDVRRIAADVARQQDSSLEVVAATPSEGESAYTEVLLTVHGCRSEPCRLIIGFSRDASEPECRRAIEAQLQQHLAKHRGEG